MGAYLTIYLSMTVSVIVILAGFYWHEDFKAVLTFAGTIIGCLTGYYFGGRSKQKKDGA
jgi:hypothetical protein